MSGAPHHSADNSPRRTDAVCRWMGYPASDSDVLCYLLRSQPWIFGTLGSEFLAAGGRLDAISFFDVALKSQEVEAINELI